MFLLSRGSASVLLTFQAFLLLKFALENLIARYLRQYGRHGPEITFHALTLRMKLIGIIQIGHILKNDLAKRVRIINMTVKVSDYL